MEDQKDDFNAIASTVIEKLQKRQMEGYYCPTREEALEKVLEIIKPGSSIGWGGSKTLEEIGLIDIIRKRNYRLYDRAVGNNDEERMEIYSNILKADYFLMSSNAITLEGELINIDGRSDRIAFLCFGPKNVIVIAGMNKITSDVESGIQRARETAAPRNGQKLKRNIPCAVTGKCSDCYSPESICSQMLITRRSSSKGRIKIILVGEELGF